MQDRVKEIPVEPWDKDDFRKVIKEGEPLLNVSFDSIVEKLIEASFDSIGVIQEICRYCCLEAGVSETSKDNIEISKDNLQNAIAKKMEDYSSRHIRCIETFVEQDNNTTGDIKPLHIPFYFIKFLLSNKAENLEEGITRSDFQSFLEKEHHAKDRVRPSDLSNFLHNIVKAQISRKINPPIFDYDRSVRKMRIIDSTFYFFLKNIDKNTFWGELSKPDYIK